MAFTRAWRNFKRMQDLTVAAAGLIYAGAVVHAFDRLPGGTAVVLRWTLMWPALFLLVSLFVPLVIAPLKRWLARYVWMSFQAGFGQTPGSIVTGVALLMGAALFIYWQVASVQATGRYQANVFSAYAAGIGILAAQAILVRALEQLPDVREKIEER
ncbi:hypothetical protein [Phenylobacterium soli]|uniref:Uncharacterized protein n=1 Tax=Phenylobacterium soli TaxID=2170551 RepID=A0A328AIE3_9CAUL|nr:hypothetical protein [Phenylobacterium soli]RAK54285.1 hypothetical protein DJ017_06975 [Phenylobacterium soli]